MDAREMVAVLDEAGNEGNEQPQHSWNELHSQFEVGPTMQDTEERKRPPVIDRRIAHIKLRGEEQCLDADLSINPANSRCLET